MVELSNYLKRGVEKYYTGDTKHYPKCPLTVLGCNNGLINIYFPEDAHKPKRERGYRVAKCTCEQGQKNYPAVACITDICDVEAALKDMNFDNASILIATSRVVENVDNPFEES